VADAILVLNAGSSSIKFSIFVIEAKLRQLLRGQIEGLPRTPRFVVNDDHGETLEEKKWDSGGELSHPEAIEFLLTWARGKKLQGHSIVAAGHRVVHGGVRFDRPVLLTPSILADLESLTPLAPLHQPHNVAAIKAVSEHAANLPQVVCFDTSFHLTQPAVARNFAIPRRWTDAGIRRYGFHGLSYEYIASVLPEIDPQAATGRTVVAHLGNGVSMCAMRGGRSIATTMGFTALDGLPMGTRSGSIDPGVLLYWLDHEHKSARQIEHLLYHESGLLGVSGISSDMRSLLQSSDPRALEAIELFVYRIGRELGSLAAALGGLDALVFTGGIGENAAAVRTSVCQGAAWFGVQLDVQANDAGESRISAPASRVNVWVIPTNEELMIARHTRSLLA